MTDSKEFKPLPAYICNCKLTEFSLVSQSGFMGFEDGVFPMFSLCGLWVFIGE
jgi:hypothetical protein